MDLKAIFDTLPKDEQDSILDPKGTSSAKALSKDGTSAADSNTIDLTGDDMKSPSQPSKKKKENEENDSVRITLFYASHHSLFTLQTSAPKVGRPKKIADSDKTAKVCVSPSVGYYH